MLTKELSGYHQATELMCSLPLANALVPPVKSHNAKYLRTSMTDSLPGPAVMT